MTDAATQHVVQFEESVPRAEVKALGAERDLKTHSDFWICDAKDMGGTAAHASYSSPAVDVSP